MLTLFNKQKHSHGTSVKNGAEGLAAIEAELHQTPGHADVQE